MFTNLYQKWDAQKKKKLKGFPWTAFSHIGICSFGKTREMQGQQQGSTREWGGLMGGDVGGKGGVEVGETNHTQSHLASPSPLSIIWWII